MVKPRDGPPNRSLLLRMDHCCSLPLLTAPDCSLLLLTASTASYCSLLRPHCFRTASLQVVKSYDGPLSALGKAELFVLAIAKVTASNAFERR